MKEQDNFMLKYLLEDSSVRFTYFTERTSYKWWYHPSKGFSEFSWREDHIGTKNIPKEFANHLNIVGENELLLIILKAGWVRGHNLHDSYGVHSFTINNTLFRAVQDYILKDKDLNEVIWDVIGTRKTYEFSSEDFKSANKISDGITIKLSYSSKDFLR